MQRIEDELALFWGEWERGVVRTEFLSPWRARYVVVYTDMPHPIAEPVFANDGVAIYRF